MVIESIQHLKQIDERKRKKREAKLIKETKDNNCNKSLKRFFR